MKSITIGTAGHIDHGKSALVSALTGKDPDRLPEEKRRGITIDLGFADLDLGDVRIGFVDVPGHERFIKNMLAGAHGIDAVALVIAADEGVMPQTREHFDICRLLGIRKGIVVVTKSDLVEDELLKLVEEEAEELVQGSFLEHAAIVPVSSKSQSGLQELKETLRELAGTIPERSGDLVPRLPVDRVFTMKGFGAVVTGTLISGQIHEGDELELLPTGMRVRARGLQVHGKSVERAFAGQRTAVNLGGVDVGSIERGMVLAPVGRLRPSQVLDVELKVLLDVVRDIRSRSRVRLHIHASEVLGRIRILDRTGSIEPGGIGFAQIRLEKPVVAVTGERFILRSYSPSQTIAGGQVLDSFAAKHRGRDFARVRTQLTSLKNEDNVERLTTFVNAAGDAGLLLSDIAARTGFNDTALSNVISEALSRGAVVRCEDWFIGRSTFDRLSELTLAEVNKHHQRESLSRGIARETLRERCFGHSQTEIFRAVIAKLEKDGSLISDKEVVRSSSHSVALSGADTEFRDRLAEVYERAGLEPPALETALNQVGINKTQVSHGRKLLQLLLDVGLLVRVQPDLIFHQRPVDELKTKLRQYGEQHEPERLIDVAAFKDLAGVSRKYAIPLLEYFDRERITRRAGDRRQILK
jgi:selenocysteine-specific elongation factor